MILTALQVANRREYKGGLSHGYIFSTLQNAPNKHLHLFPLNSL